MRLGSRKKNSRDSNFGGANSDGKLYLRVHANRAADLVPVSSNSGLDEREKRQRKNVNPVLVASVNSCKKKTVRKFNSSQPSWDALLTIPLRYYDLTQILTLTVWDKHSRYKNYLGELRLCISDILYKDGELQTSTELKWYKLYSSKSYQSFVTGSLLVSFELIIKKQKERIDRDRGKSQGKVGASASTCELGKDSDSTSLDYSKPDKVVINTIPPTEEQFEEVQTGFKNMKASEESSLIITGQSDNDNDILQGWIKTLVYPEADKGVTTPDDQGFYLDLGDMANYMSEASDVDSVVSSISVGDAKTETSTSPKSDLGLSISGMQKDYLSSDCESIATYDGVILNGDSSTHTDDEYAQSDIDFDRIDEYSNSNDIEKLLASKDRRKRSKNLFRLKKLKKKASQEGFDFSNRSVLGVIFLEIVSCKDLPPYRSINRATFDMDPFVVVTFGRKTFRTSWKRHNLNPIFNERLAFEVLPHESAFNIHFSVLDKDQFSYNDNVGTASLSMQEIMLIAAVTESELSKSESPPSKVSSNVPLNSSIFTSKSVPLESSEVSQDKIDITDDNVIESVKKNKFTNRKKVTLLYGDTSKFKTMHLNLKLRHSKFENKCKPRLKVRIRFEPYEILRKRFWGTLLEQFELNENVDRHDYIELISFLETIGCKDSDAVATKFFERHQKLAWGGDSLSFNEIIDCLEEHVLNHDALNERIFEIEKCPICCRKRLSSKQNSDIITHVAICALKDWSIVNKFLVSSYVTPQLATKRWFSKVLIKLTYGKYKLGSNSANILVQDRLTGLILEEKMGVYVRLGIRLLYKGFDTARSKRIRSLLRKLSIKQGIKFDSPQLKSEIKSFVNFHKLDLSQCLEPDTENYSTFNEFFYRKLKPDARPIEALNNSNIVVSPADCRCTAFSTVDDATELWIKGKNFTIAKLFNGNIDNLQETEAFKAQFCALGIFRLAPQDYHRFHSPVKGKITKIKFIEGEYYTVNPMAVRSELDVFGENVRAVILIETENFGTIFMVAVGAMMVGSIILTKGVGDSVEKGEEVGYFKFGGSTIILLFQNRLFQFDSDLTNNSDSSVETLIRMGQSIGHSPDVDEFKRDQVDFNKQSKDFKLNLIRIMTGGDLNSSKFSNWESTKTNLDELVNSVLVKAPGHVSDDEYSDLLICSEDSIISS